MLHPRDIYIRACLEAGKDPAADYFLYKSPEHKDLTLSLELSSVTLTLSSDKSKKVKELSYFLQEGSGKKSIEKAFSIFKSINNRILLEGLILNFSDEEICSNINFDKNTLQEYKTFFFNPRDIKKFNDKTTFLSLIHIDKAADWFKKCDQQQIQHLRYNFTGKVRSLESKETLEEIRVKMKNEFDACMVITEDMRTNGITDKQHRLLQFGLSCGKIAAKIAADELRLADNLKSLKEFMDSWEIQVEENDTEQFERQLSDEDEEDLKAQYDEISPMEEAEDDIDEVFED